MLNEHEMRVLLAGSGAPEELLRLGARSAVVTLGDAGAVVVEPGGRTTAVPAVGVEVVDTTGGGDAFTGALAWRLAAGDGLVTAVRWAVRAGAAAVQEQGAQLSSTACGKLLAEPEPEHNGKGKGKGKAGR